MLVLAATILPESARAACVTAKNAWVSTPITAQSGRFEASFDAVPVTAALDGLVGFTKSATTSFTNYAAIVRFSTNKKIDVRNGSAYKADATVAYTAGLRYHFRMVVDVTAHTYSVYVTPPNGTETLLAKDYAFRTEQKAVTSLGSYGVYSTYGTMQVWDMAATTIVNKAPVAAATATPVSGTAPLTVALSGTKSTDSDGTIASYAWDFGDGQTATGVTTSHTYTTAGTYTAKLTVTDNQGATGTASATISVAQVINQIPVAVAKCDVSSGYVPLSITFDASGSSDSDGTIASYAWNFGDGSLGSGMKVSHIYGTTGSFTATLTVTDNRGGTSTTSLPVTATVNPCSTSSTAWQGAAFGSQSDLFEARFDVIPQAAGIDGVTGLSQGTGTTYSSFAAVARFNINNTIDARNGGAYAADNTIPYVAGATYRVRLVVDVPAHTYDIYVQPDGGTELVVGKGYAFRTEQQAVTALDNWAHCCSIGTQQVCNVAVNAKARNKPPVAALTVTPLTGDAPLDVQIDASGSKDSDGTITAYELDCGDATTAYTTAAATHTYTVPGEYTVALKVTDDAGATATATATVTVTTPPITCMTSSAAFQNYDMTAQTEAFTAEYDVTPSAANMDGGIALSTSGVTGYADMATIVRFNTAGQIDARNGGTYAADSVVTYAAGTTYHIRMVVGMLAHVYSVYVTPAGGTEQTLASNYSFRTEQAAVTSLAQWSTWSSYADQTLQICNFKTGAPPSPVLEASLTSLDFGTTNENMSFELWNAGGSTLNYTITDNANWLTVTPGSGTSVGERDVITATVTRSGLAAGTYQGTITVTPSTGAALTIAVTMQYASIPQTQLKPIARWDVVPNQRINRDSTFNCGVVAFSKFGVARVQFNVIGQGYTGTNPVSVSSMSYNDQTGVWEYWTPIRGSDFTTDGPITVEASVYGNDGGVRDKTTDGGGVGLDALPLVVNPTGTLAQIEAWVSTTGNDSTGAVADSTKPFLTIGKAIDVIRAKRASLGLGDNADGGIVHLMPGSHTCATGGVAGPILCDNEWVTITTAAGGTKANTVLLPGSIVPTRKIALRGITLNGGGTLGMSATQRVLARVWADDCAIIGSGRGISGSHPLSSEYQQLYLTNSSITQVNQATSGSNLCRGLTITTIADDAFQNVPLVINCLVDDIDPLSTGIHADCWQHGGGNSTNKIDDNVIVYGLKATNMKYQSLFIRGDIYSPVTSSTGMAFVNVYMAVRSDSYGYAGWGKWVDHLLWWNCSFPVKGLGMMSDSYAGGAKVACKITNMSVKGCTFAFFGDGGANVDWTSWDNNHFVDGTVTKGTNVTTASDMLDANGIPLAGSPLLDRFSPVVPVDAANKARSGLADIGAFER
jgi:PKD repeat protein